MHTLQQLAGEFISENEAKLAHPDLVYDGIINSGKYHKGTLHGSEFKCVTCGNDGSIVFKEANKTSWLLCSRMACHHEQLKGKRTLPKIFIDIKNYVEKPYWTASLAKAPDVNPQFISYLRDLGEKKRGFCVLIGPNGTGKTWYAAAACAHYIDHEGHDLRFWKAGDLYLQFLNEYEEYGNHGRLRNALIDKEFLVIDDLGIRTPTDPFKELIYITIDARLNKNLPTIITTNLSFKEIKDYFGAAVASRITACNLFVVDGDDKRHKMGSFKKV